MDDDASVDPAERRARAFRSVPVFANLSDQRMESLTSTAKEIAFGGGARIVEEGAVADGLYVIAEGEAEVSVRGDQGAIPICVLSDGDVFGEVAMMKAGRRSASVTALTPLLAFRISPGDFDRFIAADPGARQTLATLADQMIIASFLKRIAPFARLQLEDLRYLSSRIQELSLAEGQVLFHQGDPGDACYAVRSGQLEIIRQDRAETQTIDVVGEGAVLGEASLMTDAPRNATARALDASRLLAIGRDDFLRVMGRDRRVAEFMVELLHRRERPRRAHRVTVHQREGDDGESITVLRDDIRRGIYYQLSPLGEFVWARLDGRHNVREIAMEYRASGEVADDHHVAEIVAGLIAGGFAFSNLLRDDVREIIEPQPWWRRMFRSAR